MNVAPLIKAHDIEKKIYFLINPNFYIIFFPSLLFGYLALISLLTPIFEEYYIYSLSNYFYSVLSNICHQYPTRCLWIMDRPMGLCGRCFAIYVSFSISLIFLPLKKRRTYIIFCLFLLLPLLIDGLLQYIDIRSSNNIIRVITGILFGVSSAYIYKYFSCNFITTLHEIIRKEKKLSKHFYLYLPIGIILIVITNLYGLVACFM